MRAEGRGRRASTHHGTIGAASHLRCDDDRIVGAIECVRELARRVLPGELDRQARNRGGAREAAVRSSGRRSRPQKTMGVRRRREPQCLDDDVRALVRQPCRGQRDVVAGGCVQADAPCVMEPALPSTTIGLMTLGVLLEVRGNRLGRRCHDVRGIEESRNRASHASTVWSIGRLIIEAGLCALDAAGRTIAGTAELLEVRQWAGGVNDRARVTSRHLLRRTRARVERRPA